jgi:tetratricopeptide (TPR) repeat protein
MAVIIDEAHENGIPAVAHVITLNQARDAVKAGTDGLAHMVSDQEIGLEFLAEMRQKNVYCIPTLALFDALSGGMWTIQDSLAGSLIQQGVSREVIADLAKKKEIPGIDDSLAAWRQTIDFAKINAKKMADHGIRLVVGTDAGNPAVFFGPSVHREMELMVEAGISPAKVIKAATLNAAQIVGEEDALGTISDGKLADILVVEGNPLDDIRNTQNTFLVIKNGKILDRQELARNINPPETVSLETESGSNTSQKIETVFDADIEPDAKAKIIEAKEFLKKGVDTWNSDLMKTARDRLIGLVARGKNESLYPMYYIALCDYRLATYYLTLAQMDKAGPYIKEGQDYLQKAMETNPDLGELDAFYAYMLGFEIALAPEKAMALGLQIYQYFGSAFEKSPENPRVHLLKGVSDLFTPEQYGGGADRAIETLQKSAGLFEKEQVKDPVLPSWGKDEAYTFLGMAYSQKGDNGKASEYFQKALEVNPENRLARDELKKIKK